MSGAVHTYPREWFRVSHGDTKMVSRMFDRETEHCIFYGKWREKKSCRYETWYPTREEAQAAIDARNEAKAQRVAANRIADAAPELLEHLERALNVIASWKGGLWLGEDAARAAIAKARGQ